MLLPEPVAEPTTCFLSPTLELSRDEHGTRVLLSGGDGGGFRAHAECDGLQIVAHLSGSVADVVGARASAELTNVARAPARHVARFEYCARELSPVASLVSGMLACPRRRSVSAVELVEMAESAAAAAPRQEAMAVEWAATGASAASAAAVEMGTTASARTTSFERGAVVLEGAPGTR